MLLTPLFYSNHEPQNSSLKASWDSDLGIQRERRCCPCYYWLRHNCYFWTADSDSPRTRLRRGDYGKAKLFMSAGSMRCSLTPQQFSGWQVSIAGSLVYQLSAVSTMIASKLLTIRGMTRLDSRTFGISTTGRILPSDMATVSLSRAPFLSQEWLQLLLQLQFMFGVIDQ